jgi:acyl-CoA synthetase (AMP-forming)/AMP-acid ligase II
MIRTELIASMGEILGRHAEQRPGKVAFEDSAGSSLTYGEFAGLSANLAGHLQSLGLEPGGAVAILLPNSVDWALVVAAITRADGVSVPISHDSVEAEIRYRLEDAACTAIIVSPRHLALVQRLRADLPLLAHVIVAGEPDFIESGSVTRLSLEALKRQASETAPRDSRDIHSTAVLVYTSGTTGRAKGVRLSLHGMLWVTAACWAPVARLDENDVLLSPLPLFHSYALNLCVLSILATGASAFLLERFSTQDVAERLKSGKYTLMPGVPTMFHYLMESARESGVTRFPGVQLMISAGAILPAALNREFESTFGVPLLDGYGITETSTMVTMNWPGSPRVMGSCGLPLPGLATRIVDATGLDVPFGAEGQLIVRGPNIMQGYLNKPAETADALRDGWYYTGDLARSDANGFLTITGRVKELIIRGGQNIAPAEVEDAVRAHAAVLDCAVIGMPHPHLGEVPVACVVPRENSAADPEAIRTHCTTLLSAYKVPQTVHLVESIPRTGSGKIMRFKLRDALLATVAS